MTRWTLLAPAALCAAVVGCRHVAGDLHRLPQAAPRAGSPPPGNNWPMPPSEAERLFADAPLELVSMKATPQGVAGAHKAEIRFPGTGRQVAAKWKTAPAGTFDSWNNNPRKELATYAVQRWFLDPKDYVVPTVALRCIPIDDFRRVEPKATPSLDGTTCVLGEFSLWLEHVEVPDNLYDPARFEDDYNYAYHLSNFNVLAYLVEHRDGRPGNILVADDPRNRRVFAVDNGISFGGLIYNFLTTNWDVMRVPAIPRAMVERLRALDRAKLAALGTLVEVATDRGGVLHPVPGGKPIDPDRGVRVQPGRVQMGLTTAEIDAVAERVATLLRRVDDGTLRVF